MILVDVANGKQRHVPYRDSKLTFLLQVGSMPFLLKSSSCRCLSLLNTLVPPSLGADQTAIMEEA
jgi:hypothetical protein